MRRRRHHAPFDEADLALAQTLDELDENVPNYRAWVRELIAPAVRGRMLEVGAGTGTFTTALLETATHVVAVEPSARLGSALAAATATDPRVTVVQGYVADARDHQPFDGAVLSNVLEHIEHDEALLAELADLIRPDGLVAVFSPAFQLLMSDFDRSIGHVRRYRKHDLCQRFRRAGFDVVDARYVNMPGFLAWFVVARLLGRRPTDSKLSRIYDRFVIPATRSVERRLRAPFGQSVLVIGRVPQAHRQPGADHAPGLVVP